ncbi:hypothetical protein BAUCODRAFT_347224 [Baudoinia panamericana UAMH 10762]|uniref:FAD-binding FR-type domain-containing protein n=1 Tax=Baudoinia panamericana (strain UAMH 10762) TaxID=717646 RepID=M2NKN7_BAUPA|nr:uncharacterized protein BAUCODRAFT_347224 [Baudoinia panamericana UAMH 10762]EMC99705.1 hypothetical protein BAUCODRAFT_347224 [Baudoinia panamericana UAMH 10762]
MLPSSARCTVIEVLYLLCDKNQSSVSYVLYIGASVIMAFYQDMDWHEGEQAIQRLMEVPPLDNPTVPTLSPQLARHLQIAPLLALGTVDDQGQPWTTLLGGEPGFARPLGDSIVGLRLPVTGQFDPVIEQLVGKEADGEVRRAQGEGCLVGGLTIDLETRKRVKMNGRMMAGALTTIQDEVTDHQETVAEMQLVLRIKQSLGNCPKYLNSKHITTAFAHPQLVSDSPLLPEPALKLIGQADLFFLSTSQNDIDMDTNHRGGPPGFMRVVSTGREGPTSICWPEYSGNRLYQSLGNMHINPRCGICVPDFRTGDMLYFTGRTETLAGEAASALLPRSNLCVKLTITSARYVTEALPFRGAEGPRSPYNPAVRYLASEKRHTALQEQQMQQATLLQQTRLTPTISRFRFALQNAASHIAGQYVTLDFSRHLDIGYSHMRDDDPRSINDDFVRTFTVSSPPSSSPNPVQRLKDDEFEITVRDVGVVTSFLFKHGNEADQRRYGELEVGVKGFGGDFAVTQAGSENVCFIAGGVGITPLLPSLGSLDLVHVRVLWSLRASDIGLAVDTLRSSPKLGHSLSLYLTGENEDHLAEVSALTETGVDVVPRRIARSDIAAGVSKYYICTGTSMRKRVMEWLPEEELVYEDFNF